MGPELDVLMPLNFFTTITPLEVEFGMMKADIRPE